MSFGGEIKMPLACITGAGSGIGREFARQLSRQGCALILVGRDERKLRKTAGLCGPETEIIICDLSDESACFRLAADLKKRPVDLLINNAGFGYVGEFVSGDPENDLAMFHVNAEAVHILTRAVLPRMIRADKGYILNTASTAGLLCGGPYMASYYASKAYVVSLTTSIAAELRQRGSHVHISALCPGPVRTGFDARAGVRRPLPGITPEKCVSYCLSQMKRHKLIIIPGAAVRTGTYLAKLLPRKLQSRVIAIGQKRKMT